MTVPHYDTIPEYLRHWASDTPDATAVAYDGAITTYAELAAQVDAVAKGFLAAGVRKGDRVAVLSHPHPNYWMTFLASLSIGGVWIGLNPKYRLPELTHVVNDSRPALLLGMADFAGQDFRSTLLELSALGHGAGPVFFGASVASADVDGWEQFIANGAGVSDQELAAARDQVDRESGALIVYTSGSTGKPKGAVLSHGGLARCFEIQANRTVVDKLCVVANLPINHIGCVGDLCCTPLVQGGSIVLQEQFDATAMLESVERYGVNAFMQVPTTLKILLEHPAFDSFDLSGLRYVGWGGGPMPLSVIERYRELGVQLGTTYGMTEITGSITYTDHDATDEVLANTVGRPIDEMEYRLVDDAGNEVAPGERGEVLVRHPGQLLEYFENPEGTADSLSDDGFFKTGDVGYLRPDGNMCLVARTKEIFKSGGYNTYPREIELVLEEFPQVRLAAVVPVAHPLYDEVGVAYVEMSGDEVAESVLIGWCKERLANYKVPKRIIRVDSLPLLPVGKVDKMELRTIAAEQIGPELAGDAR